MQEHFPYATTLDLRRSLTEPDSSWICKSLPWLQTVIIGVLVYDKLQLAVHKLLHYASTLQVWETLLKLQFSWCCCCLYNHAAAHPPTAVMI